MMTYVRPKLQAQLFRNRQFRTNMLNFERGRQETMKRLIIAIVFLALSKVDANIIELSV